MTINDQLLEHFPKAGKQDWQRSSAAEINGKDALETLQWRSTDDVTFLPYYDPESLNEIHYLQKFHFPDQSSEHSGPRSWQNIPNVSVKDEKAAQAVAMDHLKNGADGILFTLSSTTVNFPVLLDQIEWPHCSLYFVADNFQDDSLSRYILGKKWETQELQGAIFRKNLPLAANPAIKGLRWHGIFISRSSQVEEISEALKKGVDRIYALQEKGLDRAHILQQIAFSFPVTSHVLTEISKLKAFRMLWYQVVRAFGVNNYQPEDLLLLTRAEVWIDEKFQPHGNLINSTIASLAAVAGGSNAHTVYAELEQDRLMSRVARNNSILLTEESHLGKVSDPLAGAYAIENMTHELAQAAWKKFQEQI